MANGKTLDEKIQDAHAKAGYPSGEAFEDGFRRGYAAGLRDARNALDEHSQATPDRAGSMARIRARLRAGQERLSDERILKALDDAGGDESRAYGALFHYLVG